MQVYVIYTVSVLLSNATLWCFSFSLFSSFSVSSRLQILGHSVLFLMVRFNCQVLLLQPSLQQCMQKWLIPFARWFNIWIGGLFCTGDLVTFFYSWQHTGLKVATTHGHNMLRGHKVKCCGHRLMCFYQLPFWMRGKWMLRLQLSLSVVLSEETILL